MVGRGAAGRRRRLHLGRRRARYARGDVIRERRTVVYGDGATAVVLPPAAELDDAVGLRINDRAFDKIEPVVKSPTTIDTGAIAPRRHGVPR